MLGIRIGAIFVAVLISVLDIVSTVVTDDIVVKCCEDGFVIGDDMKKCVMEEDGSHKSEYRKILEELDLYSNNTDEKSISCFQDFNGTSYTGNFTSNNISLTIDCVDFQKNGSLIQLNCSEITKKQLNNTCDTIFTQLTMYGATMMIFANIVYVITYSLVCMLYAFIPGLCRRAYDKAVLCFIITQLILSIVVIILGHYMLCHKPLSRVVASFIGLGLMTFTISGVLWLLVISFDVSSTITSFRWAPSSGAKGRNENHKFRVYSWWVIGGTMIPTTLTAILQFLPIPDEFILKPNFHIVARVNFRVVVYVITMPICAAIMSNVLFIYTTVMMIRIQKSTNIAHENRKKSVMERYILYLKLYLLMDAPYITGALGSIYKDLWILKFARTLQPILLLYAVLPREIIINAFKCGKKASEGKEQVKLRNNKDGVEY